MGTASEAVRPLAELKYAGDVQEVLLLDPLFTQLIAILERSKSMDSGWVQAEYDLTPWRGRTLVLYFNVFNRDAAGRTWMYVDDVSVQTCLP